MMRIPWRNLKRFLNKIFKQPGYAADVFVKRAKAYFSYYFGKGKSSFPEAITLFLTYRCNLRCKMCGQWGESGVTKKHPGEYIKKELSLEELKGLIDDIAGFKPNITLFGGEPLLYPAWFEAVRHIKEKGMHCLMITNGSLLKDIAENVVESNLDELNVSLDGGRRLHDEIRGMPGLYDKIMSGLKRLNHCKEKMRKRKPLINLQCTITKYNAGHLKELLEVANEAGADSLTFHNLIFLERSLIERQKEYDNVLGCTSRDWEGFIFDSGIDPENLYREMQGIRNRKYRFTVDFYPNFSLKGLKEYYKNPSYLPSEYPARCLSPWMTAYIFPDGELRPCLNFGYSYGNVRNKKFSEIWNGASAIKYRRVLKGENIFPVCVRCTELYRY